MSHNESNSLLFMELLHTWLRVRWGNQEKDGERNFVMIIGTHSCNL
jgi:hypothetical protein